ncbi:MAG: cupin domain-containing protein [Chitinophagaceae bacterium]|nr:cupin domain-containing protein [Chitinophagaceae bacterium]
MKDAHYWIKHLDLTKHVEGGCFSEVYRSPLMTNESFPDFESPRNIATTIYFLLEHPDFSAFHKIKSDEIWHFYAGDGLLVHEINMAGVLTTHQLGPDPDKGERFQCVITAGNWFASEVIDGGRFALAGCTVSPGFDFRDFALADRSELSETFNQHSNLIERLTR